jgi:ABC-type cobalamin transport system ATPase subunit
MSCYCCFGRSYLLQPVPTHNTAAAAAAALQAPDGVEETDELLLWDEEMADVDLECLPKRLITDLHNTAAIPAAVFQARDGVEETDELLLWDEEMAAASSTYT